MKIMMKNTVVANINTVNGAVTIFDAVHMPYDLYFEELNDFDTRVNNVLNFDAWCSSRMLSLDRENAKAILNSCGLSQATTDRERREVAVKYNCLTLNDYYWVQEDGDTKDWNDISLYKNSLHNVVVDVALRGVPLTVTNLSMIAPEVSTAGVFPKAWVREKDGFYLYKGDVNDSVRKEVEAGKILEKLGFRTVVYDYARWDGQKTSKCKIFTDENTCYVTAEHYGYNYDIRKNEDFYRLVLATYLVGDSDKHWGNWGYLYGQDGLHGMAPLMDFNHAFESVPKSPSLPHICVGERKTQYEAAKEALEYVNIKECDLSEFSYGAFVDERLESLGLRPRRVTTEHEEKDDNGDEERE